jgi:hypothetical protein
MVLLIRLPTLTWSRRRLSLISCFVLWLMLPWVLVGLLIVDAPPLTVAVAVAVGL